jgi:hypothetical protein
MDIFSFGLFFSVIGIALTLYLIFKDKSDKSPKQINISLEKNKLCSC